MSSAIILSIILIRSSNSPAAQSGQRILELEKRLAVSREETYRPMIEMIQNALDSAKCREELDEKKLRRVVSDFMTWAQIYASDEVVQSADRWMKASVAAAQEHPKAGTISTYYIGSFLLALRKDLGVPDTRLTVRDILAPRILDIYETSIGHYLVMNETRFLREIDWGPALVGVTWSGLRDGLALLQTRETILRVPNSGSKSS